MQPSTSSPHQILHLVLTRFNVRSGGKEERIRSDPDWLASRFRLFEQFCYPSVAAQTSPDFRWLVFFDDQTPAEFVKRIEHYRDLVQFDPIFVGEWKASTVHDAVAARIPCGCRLLLTTRLDNDDGLHHRYFEVLRASIREEALGFYNFPNGVIFRSGRLFEHEDKSNAFISYLERPEGFVTVWKTPHHKIGLQETIWQLPLRHAWLQVVHENNVSNRVKGTRVKGRELEASFFHLPGIVLARESVYSEINEQFFFAPVRHVREFLIRHLKSFLAK